MGQSLALVEGWWNENPLLTTFGLALALVAILLLLLVLGIAFSPRMRILYRAIRRVLWTKIGTTRNGPPLPRQFREHLDQKRFERLLMATEGAAFGRTGVIYLTAEEIGFVSMRFGMMNEMNVPFAQVTEAKISKGPLYDYVTVTTRERAETLRLYHADRDVGQEFFNHLQMRLGAMRFRKP
jgi:hypothetical protein